MDLFFHKFRSAIAELVAPLFSFEMKEGAWYEKQDLVELMLHMAVTNSFAEGIANILRCQGRIPTGETLLDYVKTLTCDEMLAEAEAQVDRCVKMLKTKGLRLKDVAARASTILLCHYIVRSFVRQANCSETCTTATCMSMAHSSREMKPRFLYGITATYTGTASSKE